MLPHEQLRVLEYGTHPALPFMGLKRTRQPSPRRPWSGRPARPISSRATRRSPGSRHRPGGGRARTAAARSGSQHEPPVEREDLEHVDPRIAREAGWNSVPHRTQFARAIRRAAVPGLRRSRPARQLRGRALGAIQGASSGSAAGADRDSADHDQDRCRERGAADLFGASERQRGERDRPECPGRVQRRDNAHPALSECG